MTSEERSFTGRGLLVEAVVIIASILLAFAIDAQWELAQARRDVAALVESLEEDFRATVTEAQRVVGNHGGGADAAERLIVLAESRPLVASDAVVVDSLLSIIRVSGASFDPPQGAMEALIESGSLRSLDEPELAGRLTGWPAEVADLRDQEAGLDIRLLRLDDILMGLGVRTDYLIATNHTGAEFGVLPWERRATTAWRALDDAAARGALADVYLALRFATVSAEARLVSVTQIHELLMELVE